MLLEPIKLIYLLYFTPGAIPSVFPGCPSYMSKTKPTPRKQIIKKTLSGKKRLRIDSEVNSRAEGKEDPFTPCEPSTISVLQQLCGDELCVPLPFTWSRNIPKFGPKVVIFTQLISTMLPDGRVSVAIFKQICVKEDGIIEFAVLGNVIDNKRVDIQSGPLESCSELEEIIGKVDVAKVCRGDVMRGGIMNLDSKICVKDSANQWRHENCMLIIEAGDVCCYCKQARRTVLQMSLRRTRKCNMTRLTGKLSPQKKRIETTLRKKNFNIKRSLFRAKNKISNLRNKIHETMKKVAEGPFQDKLQAHPNLSRNQVISLKEIFSAANTVKKNGRRYSEDWMLLCMLFHVRSPAGYKFARESKILPLPTIRTVRRYLSLVDTSCGFDDRFFELFKRQLCRKKDIQRHGVILWDEMSVRQSLSVCCSNLSYVGLSDFGEDGPNAETVTEMADHALVVMFQPIADTYTQPVAMFASNGPVKGEVLAKILLKAIFLLEKSGAKVHGFTSDSASTNRKLWTKFGIRGQLGSEKNSFQHPLDPNRKIFAFADTPHLLKNIRNRLLTTGELKHHHQHHDTDGHQPSPDFERQLEQLKERGSSDQASPVPEQPPPLPPKQQPPPLPPKQPPSNEEEPPVAPISRKDELFTPGLGVEEVSFLGPIRKPGAGSGGAGEGAEGLGGGGAPAPGGADTPPLQPDLLESEADVLEELKKLSGLHDAVTDPLLVVPQPRVPATLGPPPQPVREARVVGIGGATGDHFVAEMVGGGEDDEDDDEGEDDDEDDMEDELDEDSDEDDRTEVSTLDPEKEVISLEERLSASLRELAELRRRQALNTRLQPESPPAPGPGAALGGGEVGAEGTLLPGIPSPGAEAFSRESKRGGEGGTGPGSRAAMRKAHMARKLMDPEDPKKDEDLLELMLRIAENPDEWKRVHSLLRQLDDDLTTYEKTMHRVQALATERSTVAALSTQGEEEQRTPAAPLSERDARREEMARSGLPAGTHGEAPPGTTTTQHPPPSIGHHKDWPKFAYHRVTTAPHPDPFLQQHHESLRDRPAAPSASSSSSGAAHQHQHRNAYIAVSVITPPGSRGGKQPGAPIPSPPPAHAVPPTQARQLEYPYEVKTTSPPFPRAAEGSRRAAQLVDEETLGVPGVVGEEEKEVDQLARRESSMHRQMHHAEDPVEQLRALAAVEEKLRHHMHEKERMRHLLKDGADEDTKRHRKSERSIRETARHYRHSEGDHIALKTS